MNFPVILGRSTRKIPKSSRVPRSPFVIFLAHFLKKIYAGCGALLFLKKGRNFDVQEDTERDIFDFKNFRKISKYFVNRVHKNCEPGSQNCEPGSQFRIVNLAAPHPKKQLITSFRRIPDGPVPTNVRGNFRWQKTARIRAQAGYSASSRKGSK